MKWPNWFRRSSRVQSPESHYIVEVTDEGVSCRHPSEGVHSIRWDALKIVTVETNASGPWGIDVWWVLEAEGTNCAVPQGATGEEALVLKLQALPDFDNAAMIEAASSTDNQRFVCWQKKSQEAV